MGTELINFAIGAVAGFLLVFGEPISHRIAARHTARQPREQK